MNNNKTKIHTSVYINGAEAECVNNFRFLRINITGNLLSHISNLTKKA